MEFDRLAGMTFSRMRKVLTSKNNAANEAESYWR